MIYYLIRHKATQQYMPQAKKNRGYTNWNPGNSEAHEFTAALSIPRLIDTRKKAAGCINAWASMPNGHMKWDHEGDGDIGIKDDGRKKEDLEVVEVDIRETKDDTINFAIKALKNYGADIDCGACMEIAFTGMTTNKHTCKEK